MTATEFRKSMGCVADSTLGVAAASFDFSGLPTTYAHLMVVAYLRSDAASTWDWLSVRFNNDTAANYDSQYDYVNAATSTISELLAQTSMRCGGYPGNTAAANLFSQHSFVVPFYGGSTNNKGLVGQSTHKYGTATGNLFTHRYGGHWRSSAAINRITLVPASGNFVAGSRCSVYAMGS